MYYPLLFSIGEKEKDVRCLLMEAIIRVILKTDIFTTPCRSIGTSVPLSVKRENKIHRVSFNAFVTLPGNRKSDILYPKNHLGKFIGLHVIKRAVLVCWCQNIAFFL